MQPTSFSDEEAAKDLEMVRRIEELFEEHRTTECLTFDVTKQEKAPARIDRKDIKALLDAIDVRYPYKQTLSASVLTQHNKPAKNGKKRAANKHKHHAKNQSKSPSKSRSVSSSGPCPAPTAISRPLHLYLVGRYHGTASLLQEAVKACPSLSGCWNSLGELYCAAGEVLAAKFCFASSLAHSRHNKLRYISLSKMLRNPTGKDQMAVMEDCMESLVLAKQALKHSKSHKKLSLKDGELWFNLDNAYLMVFLQCTNGWKLDSSAKLEQLEQRGDDDDEKVGDYFLEEREQERIHAELRREIEAELREAGNSLLSHVPERVQVRGEQVQRQRARVAPRPVLQPLAHPRVRRALRPGAAGPAQEHQAGVHRAPKRRGREPGMIKQFERSINRTAFVWMMGAVRKLEQIQQVQLPLLIVAISLLIRFRARSVSVTCAARCDHDKLALLAAD